MLNSAVVLLIAKILHVLFPLADNEIKQTHSFLRGSFEAQVWDFVSRLNSIAKLRRILRESISWPDKLESQPQPPWQLCACPKLDENSVQARIDRKSVV